MRRVGLVFAIATSIAGGAAAAPLVVPVSTSPAPVPSPVPRTGIMVPQTVMLRPTTPKEAEANAVWSLRAGLNVAALQCQFSPFLATVRTYNDLLKHHSAEFAAAQATMQAHFKRLDGARGLNSFDQYSTRMYNSYSTLDAQYAFCEAAALAGRGALMLRKGALGKFALIETPVLRQALTPGPATFAATPVEPVALLLLTTAT